MTSQLLIVTREFCIEELMAFSSSSSLPMISEGSLKWTHHCFAPGNADLMDHSEVKQRCRQAMQVLILFYRDKVNTLMSIKSTRVTVW